VLAVTVAALDCPLAIVQSVQSQHLLDERQTTRTHLGRSGRERRADGGRESGRPRRKESDAPVRRKSNMLPHVWLWTNGCPSFPSIGRDYDVVMLGDCERNLVQSTGISEVKAEETVEEDSEIKTRAGAEPKRGTQHA
jgi:hypothetical protein